MRDDLGSYLRVRPHLIAGRKGSPRSTIHTSKLAVELIRILGGCSSVSRSHQVKQETNQKASGRLQAYHFLVRESRG